MTGELRQGSNYRRTLTPGFEIRTYPYVHLWILDVFSDFWGVIYVHTSTNGSPGWVNMHVNNFFVCGPKFKVFFSSNVGGDVVDQLLFRFSICGPFRIYWRSKSKVVRNREKFWTVFLPSQILEGKPSKNCTHVITPGSRLVVWIKICDDIPISREVIDVHTLNFKPDFKFSRLFFCGGTPVQLGVQ